MPLGRPPAPRAHTGAPLWSMKGPIPLLALSCLARSNKCVTLEHSRPNPNSSGFWAPPLPREPAQACHFGEIKAQSQFYRPPAPRARTSVSLWSISGPIPTLMPFGRSPAPRARTGMSLWRKEGEERRGAERRRGDKRRGGEEKGRGQDDETAALGWASVALGRA